MKDQVPEEEKRWRLAELNKVIDESAQKKHRSYLGQIVEVLVEKGNDLRRDQLTGRTSTNKTVNFEGSAEMVGSIVRIKITDIKVHTLFGVLA